MTPDDPAAEAHVLAGELALGVLTGDERIAALERMLADPAFAAEVGWWRERLAGLLHDYADAAAPPLRPGFDDDAATPMRRARRWPWVAAGAGGGAAAAAAVVLAVMSGRDAAPAPTRPSAATPTEQAGQPTALMAVLTPAKGEDGEPVAVLVDRSTRTIRFTATITVPADRVAELWRIGADSVPHPIALLPASERSTAPQSVGKLPLATETIAISIEPRGGSATGKPTGPVIASGKLVRT